MPLCGTWAHDQCFYKSDTLHGEGPFRSYWLPSVPFLSEPIVSVSSDLGNLKLEGKIPRGFDNVLYISHAALGNSGMKRNNMTPFW